MSEKIKWLTSTKGPWRLKVGDKFHPPRCCHYPGSYSELGEIHEVVAESWGELPGNKNRKYHVISLSPYARTVWDRDGRYTRFGHIGNESGKNQIKIDELTELTNRIGKSQYIEYLEGKVKRVTKEKETLENNVMRLLTFVYSKEQAIKFLKEGNI